MGLGKVAVALCCWEQSFLDVGEEVFSDFCASIATGIARTTRARKHGRIAVDAINYSLGSKDYLSAAASLT